MPASLAPATGSDGLCGRRRRGVADPYSGASGIFVIAVGAVIFDELIERALVDN